MLDLVQVQVVLPVDVWRVVQFIVTQVNHSVSHAFTSDCALFEIPMGRNLKWISLRCINKFRCFLLKHQVKYLGALNFYQLEKNRYCYGCHSGEFSNSSMDNFYDPKIYRIIENYDLELFERSEVVSKVEQEFLLQHE